MDSILLLIGFISACFLMYILPSGWRKYLLLMASMVFFVVSSWRGFVYVTMITLVSYGVGRWLDSKTGICRSRRGRRGVLVSVVVIMVALLAGIKYSALWREEALVIPLGLSYYSLMVIGYLVEVYRGTEKAEKNLCDYGLFVSFFPQVVAGPIGRSKDLRQQYQGEIALDGDGIRKGFAMLMFGVFEKVVLADNLRVFVDNLFASEYRGVSVWVAVLLYSLVIYFDFAGYSLIAVGGARMLGIRLMDNFNAPYRAETIQEFWRRWHISLSSWFRDYVYIPLGGSRKGAWRRDLNTMIVFVLSGAWHGATVGFILWGGLHGIYQMVGKWTKDWRQQLWNRVPGCEKARMRWWRRGVVYVLVSIAWIPFQAGSVGKMWNIWCRLWGFSPHILVDGSLFELGLNLPTLVVCGVGTILIFVVDWVNQKKDFYLVLSKRPVVLRYSVYVLLFVVVLLVGAYGDGYDASEFIYGGF